MERPFSPEDVRVLGALMEKEMTTPEYYPMTPNALKAACNQKTNRHPVTDYSEEEVVGILDGLRRRTLVRIVSGSGMRTIKYEHRMRDLFFLSQPEAALLTVMMLRGPQTAGELRARSDRMATFDGIGEVESVLADLANAERQPHPLVARLPLAPGRKEPRYAHLLFGEAPEDIADPVAAESRGGRVTDLEERVTRLEAELAGLREAFDRFREQF